MSDVMLHGVLCMPPELWQDTELDKRQRYSRYLAASRRIEDDEREIEALRKVVDAARCIRHWHDRENGGMVVSGEHVRELWQALHDLDERPNAALTGAEGVRVEGTVMPRGNNGENHDGQD